MPPRARFVVRLAVAHAAIIAAFLAVGSVGGCGPGKLETGYVPRPLGSTEDVRRGYYAGPFSPEARAAQAARDKDTAELRRPRPGE